MNTHSELLTELLRPQSLSELCLPDRLRKKFQRFVGSGNVMNLTFYGQPGTGKTSTARVIAKEFDSIELNGGDNQTDKAMINRIRGFASSASLPGQLKLCIINEADALSTSVQNLLQCQIENLSKNCRFLLTTNNINSLAEPIRSRCRPVSFNMIARELKEMKENSAEFYLRRLEEIRLPVDNERLKQIIEEHLPDHRSIVNEIQLQFGTPGEEEDTQS